MINVKMQSNKPSDLHKLSPKIAVIGVGGAGGNAVNNMISSNLEGCEFLACNTDAQALQGSLSQSRIQLGVNITGGLGAGSKPEVGRAAAEESLEEVLRYLDGANMAFVTAGMGGGTGTGAAPVIAKACREQGILTVGVVTKPFHFEGAHRMEQAERGIAEMQQYVDTLIVIPNQNLFRIANEKTTFAEAFKMADTVLQSGVRGVTDLMVRPGLVNLDFADIKTAMQQMGKAMMGTGEASGDKRAIQAAEAAINNPLLDDVSMKGAHGVIINVTGGYDMTLFEADEACNRIRDEVDPSANIIFGATFDDTMEGKMRVSIVATGIEREVGKNKVFSGGTGGGGGGIRTDNRTPGQLLDRSPVSAQTAAPAAAPAASAPMVSVPADRTAASMAQRDIGMYATGRETVRNLKAPAPISETVRPQQQQSAPDVFSTGRKIQEQMAEISSAPDMFSQQQEFPVYGDRPQYGHAQPSAPQQESGLRGTTYKDAFIPPRPMEADVAIPENGIGSHISSFHGAHVESRSTGEPVSSLRLNAPAGAPSRNVAAAPQQRKAPSLFERITGSVQQHLDSFRDDGDMVKQRPLQEQPAPYQPAAGVVPPRHAVGGGSPAQAAMNMSSPAAKPVSKQDEDLDIPAFLRRQAN